MYTEYFQLRTKPFELLPNPDFLYPSKAHKKAIAYLEYGLRERAGFILLTGEVGAGKTTLIRDLLKRNTGDMLLSKIFNTRVDAVQLVTMINDDFGLETEAKDKVTMLRELNEFLIEQYAMRKRPVLIIDEAQNLSMELLEDIRLLSNLETDNAHLLQIILVGQPELRDRIRSPKLIQLRQRILVSCHLAPLSAEETREYIYHRMEKAGNSDALQWDEGVLEALHNATRGIPRLVNILCDYVLLDAYAAERKNVNVEILEDLLSTMDFERQFWPVEEAQQEQVKDGYGSRCGDDAQGEMTSSVSQTSHRVGKILSGLAQRVASLEQAQMTSGEGPYLELMERQRTLEQRLSMFSERLDRLHSEQVMLRMQKQREPVPVRDPEPVRVAAPEAQGGWFRRWFAGG